MTRARATPSRRARVRGMTLLEVLIGLVIFMIGALGMMAFVGKSLGNAAESRARAQAALLAQEFYSRLDLSVSTADRGATAATYRAALAAAAPVVFDAWRAQALQTAQGLADADAAFAIVDDNQSARLQLTITWRIRSDKSAAGLENAPVRTYVTSRPVI